MAESNGEHGQITFTDRLKRFVGLGKRAVVPLDVVSRPRKEVTQINTDWEKLIEPDFPLRQESLRNINLKEELEERRGLIARMRSLEDKAKGFPERELQYRFTSIVHDLIPLATFDHQISEDGYPKDKIYRKLMEMFESFKLSRHLKDNVGWLLLGRVKDKTEIVRILSPGSFLAHGGYTHDLKSMIAEGGLMSVVARVNKGNPQEVHGHRVWNVGGGSRLEEHPHNASLWFYHWQGNEKAGIYASPRFINSREVPETSDMTILYPAERAVIHSRVIEMSCVDPGIGTKREIGLTNSKLSLQARKFVWDPNDDTCLPLAEAYFIVPMDRQKEVTKDFTEAGFSEQWCQDHLYPIQINRQVKYTGNDMEEALRMKRSEIDQWLANQVQRGGRTFVRTFTTNESSAWEFHSTDFVNSFS